MLRACRRALRPGGRLAFYTILASPDLSDADYRRALRLGPPGVASGKRGQQQLLHSAGFVEVSEADLTVEFLRIARERLAARERHAPALRQSEGESQFEQKQAKDRREVEAIEAGLLRRSLLVAKRPG